MSNLVIAGLLLAHGLIHASYLSPRPPATAGGPAWPFDLERSRLLGSLGYRGTVPRSAGVALVAVTVAGFALAALATLGVAPGSLLPAGVMVGALASLAVLVVYYHPWLTLGLAIDVLLLYAVFVAGWWPEGLEG
jgi:hypothetical protein